MAKIILISGKAGHGKDLTATIMKEELESKNYSVIIIKFGDAVKWLAHEYLGYKGIKDTSDRQILQFLGTEVMRQYNPDYWAEIVGQFLAAMQQYNKWDYCIISDWRFPNEYQVLKKYITDIITIRISRYEKNLPYINSALTSEQRNHSSECSLDNYFFSYVIQNDDTIDALKNSILNKYMPLILQKEKKCSFEQDSNNSF